MDADVQCKMCRICMRSDSKIALIGLFEHIVQTQILAKVVSLVGAVEVKQDDELPKLCCVQCLGEAEAAYKLRILCQESDVKLRSLLPGKAAVVKKESFSDDEMHSLDSKGLISSDEVLAQMELEELNSLNHVRNKSAVVKKESFSDDEMNSNDPEEHTGSDKVPVQTEFVELKSVTSDALKYEYDEITTEESRCIDANYSESDQCSENKRSGSENVNESSFNYHEMKNVSEHSRRSIDYNRVLKTFDEYPAVKFGCCGCISSFDTIEELRTHGHEKHRSTDLEGFILKERQCDICFKVLFNRRAYNIHRKNVMYNYRCKICDEILLTLKQVIAHRKHPPQRTPTADEVLICCGCNKQFHSAEALRIHSDTMHLPSKPPSDEKKPVTCNICYRNYTTKLSLRTHKLGYLYQMKNYQCKECEQSFGKPYQLRYHEKSFHAKPPVILDHASTSTPDALKHEYEEMTIEDTRLTDAYYSELDQYSESKSSGSENVNEDSYNNQELETNVSENKKRSAYYSRVFKAFDEYPAVKFGCCGCISSFDTIEELHAHGRERHLGTDLEGFTLKERQCAICFKVLYSDHAFDFHRKNVMFNYRCKMCDENLITLKQAFAHKRLHTPTADEALVCCGCKLQFHSAEALKNHSDTIHLPEKLPPDEKKPVTCNICYRNFKSTLRWHKISYLKNGKNYHCKECGKSFGRPYELRRHVQVMHTKSYIRPVTFNHATTSTHDATEYVQNSSNNQELKTNVSDNKPLRVDYTRLLKTFDEYPAVKFSCCGCTSSFDTFEELRAHGHEKHRGTGFILKERQCDICFIVLSNGKSYDHHRKNVMYNYRCKICDEIVISLKETYAHRKLKHSRTPTADEVLICCGCKLQCHSAEALKNHSETIHLPEKPPPDERKPVTCNICYRNFSCKETLRIHKRGYLNQMRNYQCKECGKSFGRPFILKRHVETVHAK